jgi:uncharacterized protein involved in exopolysaccharide biosynthesis
MKPDSLAATILGWRRLVVGATVVAVVVSVVVSLLLPTWFRAVATVLPPSEGTSSAGFLSMISQLSSDFGAGPGRAARRLLSRTPGSEIMIGVLKSRHIRGKIVDQFDLQEVYDAKTREHAIKELGEHLVVNTSPEGLIEVRVEDRDRERAAEMANAFVDHLDTFNREMSVADARRSLEFIGRALDESGKRLDEATGRFREFQEEKGTVELGAQVEATVKAIAELQAQEARLETERGVLEQFSTPEQFEMRRIESQIREVRKQIDALTAPRAGADSAAASGESGVFLPLANLPRLGLEYAELKRDVLVREKVYEFLTGQLEDARIREASDQQTITVLDVATPPLRKARPRRSLIVLITVGLTAFASALLAFGADALLRSIPAWGPAQREALAPAIRLARLLEARFGPPPAGVDSSVP